MPEQFAAVAGSVDTSTTEYHTIRLTSVELASYPQLSQLTALINKSFVTSWHTIPCLVGPDEVRYQTQQDFVEDMGKDSITFVTLSGKAEPIATAGYKKWEAVWKTGKRLRKEGDQPSMREQEMEQNAIKYEIVAVAVDTTMQKSGLSSNLVSRITEEIASNTRMSGGSKYTLMVRAGKETVEKYWTKQGFATMRESYFKPGDFGSETGFTILDMFKDQYV